MSKGVLLWEFGENIYSLRCDDNSVLELRRPAEIHMQDFTGSDWLSPETRTVYQVFAIISVNTANTEKPGSKIYLLSSADTAVHLSFNILYSTHPSITMGSTNQTDIFNILNRIHDRTGAYNPWHYQHFG